MRYGAILKDANTGRIVGHLQETGLWRDALSETVSFASGGPVNAVASVFQTVQNEQIKSRLGVIQETLGAMHGLQVATLSASVLGIGVTVASTALVLRKLGALSDTAERIETRIDDLPRQFREESLHRLLTDLRTQLSRLDESGVRSDRIDVLHGADERLHATFDQLAGMLSRSIATDALRPDLYRTALASLALCAGAQFRTLLLLNEREGAARRASGMLEQVNALAWKLPADRWDRMADGDRDLATGLAADMRELRARLACQPATARMLLDAQIDGRAYIEQAERETDEAFLVTSSGLD